MRRLLPESPLLTRVVQGILGALGFYAAVRFLPKVLRAMTRRFLFGLVGEILLVAVGLFLTRRAAEGPSRNGDTDERGVRNGPE